MKPASEPAPAPQAQETTQKKARPVNDSPVMPSKSRGEINRAAADEGPADAELVRRCQSGDNSAFEQLFVRYRGRAFAVAFGVLKHEQDALDVVQESFVKAHRSLAKFEGQSSFYTWLYRIVMNLAIDYTRRNKRRRSLNFEGELTNRSAEALGGHELLPSMNDYDPGRALERRELSSKLMQALDELPAHHQAVVVLREIEGLSYEQIAEVVQVPKGTVMSRLFHARRKLQESLREYRHSGKEGT